ncbi:hypothetical protein DFA_04368 [Cavenderia fasciculata]|uniref:CMP/dCMP-type deaminase domain-containing protein n=1 Tax=Cavenderia fasciculata TaxID=261658 RepID=F4PPD7_CACFS|nr:uncharacterized protein DFA_04368 [Cavenderia fasciculata]EGG22250.1 hypothetical protein DFA_04368 [Cavenderia fasciculata]|eukprot:XP_004360101.1 hypothetical protein DFA_04368 [Cavenderia fasciculata]
MYKVLSLLFVLLSVIFAVQACAGDYDPSKVTIGGNCPATSFAQWKQLDEGVVLNPTDIPIDELVIHQAGMAHVIEVAKALNKKFVASIYFPNGTLACIGVNTGSPNMIAHGETVAINNCTALYGIKSFTNFTLYTTGEPCAMCAGALVWADFKTIVWGTFNRDLYCKICMSNIPMDSSYIFARAFGLGANKAPRVIGGVLRAQSDAWFGSYCSRPTSIYYIKPECACNKAISVSQRVVTSYSGYTQFEVSLVNYGPAVQGMIVQSDYTLGNNDIWTLNSTLAASGVAPNTYTFYPYKDLFNANEVLTFGYRIQGSYAANFTLQFNYAS